MFGRKKRRLSDFDSEIESHLDLATDQYREEGLDEREAHYAALRQFGNITIARERFYEAGRWLWLDTLSREIRMALRLFRRHLLVFCVALGGLALAISLCTVLFTYFNALLFRPVGIADPASAVHVRRITRSGGGMHWPIGQFEQLRDVVQQTILEPWSEVELDYSAAVPSSGSGESASIQLVSGAYFTTFGGTASLGRVLRPDDDGLGLTVGVMNHEFWRRSLDADESIVGRYIYVAGRPVRIVGVAANGFEGITTDMKPPALWIPMQRAHPEAANNIPFSPRDGAVRITGRLKSGVAHPQAQAEIASLAARLDDGEGPSRTVGAELVSLNQRDRSGTILSSIIIVAGFLILALAATNAASLLIALAITRRTEIRIRMAVGAGRMQLIRQWLVESSLVSAISGAAGFAVAYLLMSWIVRVVDLPATVNFIPGLRALIFAALLTCFAALVLGLLPFRFSIFKSTALGRQTSNPRFPGSRRLRSFIAVQGAVSVILMILAALCARVLVHVARFDYGFDVNRLATVRMISIGADGHPYEGDFGSYRDIALERARLLPNVEAAALADYDPLSERPGDSVWVNRTSADFFKTVGFHFVRGRGYSADEVRSGTDVAVITSNLSKKLWGTEDPLGRTLEAVNDRMCNTVVIGVIDDAWTNRLIGSVDSGTVYRPLHSVASGSFAASVIVRARTNGASIVPQLRVAIQAIDPDRRPHVYALSQARDRQLKWTLTRSLIASGLAILAVVFALVGLSGITAFTVAQRRREMAIRIALGATSAGVLWLCMRDCLRPLIVGLAVGLAFVLVFIPPLAGRFLGNLLAGINPRDPLAVTLSIFVLITLSALAVLVSARSAVRFDPAVELRSDFSFDR